MDEDYLEIVLHKSALAIEEQASMMGWLHH